MESGFDEMAQRLAEDVDVELLKRSLARTPAQRIAKLMEMQGFMKLAKEARTHAAHFSSPKAR